MRVFLVCAHEPVEVFFIPQVDMLAVFCAVHDFRKQRQFLYRRFSDLDLFAYRDVAGADRRLRQLGIQIVTGFDAHRETGLHAVADHQRKPMVDGSGLLHVFDAPQCCRVFLRLRRAIRIAAQQHCRIYLDEDAALFFRPCLQRLEEGLGHLLVCEVHDRSAGNVHHAQAQRQPADQDERGDGQPGSFPHADDLMISVGFHLGPGGRLQQIAKRMRLDKGVVLTGIDAVDELIHLAFCLFCMAYISYNSLADMFITALKKLTFFERRGDLAQI